MIQQDFALAISTEENKVKNIQNAVTNANDLLVKLTGNLNGLNDQINLAKKNGLQLTQRLNVALNNQDGIKGQITGAKATITKINLSIQSADQVCTDANGIIFKLNGNVNDLKASIVGIDQKVAGIDG